ncbi:MAG: hypothetical protein IPO93_13280 [Actinobacteria bacterium]|nr:hypothetical protein [Actinomycetota bacterium]
MSERSNLRLLVLAVLVASLLGTLVARAFYLQVMTGETYRAAAEDNTVRELVEPAVRGLIVDQAGRPLVSNRTSVVVTVDRLALQQEPDNGATVITRLADILDMPVEKITERLDNCGTEGAKPRPSAGTGPRTSRCRWRATSTRRSPCRSWSGAATSRASRPSWRRSASTRPRST